VRFRHCRRRTLALLQRVQQRVDVSQRRALLRHYRCRLTAQAACQVPFYQSKGNNMWATKSFSTN